MTAAAFYLIVTLCRLDDTACRDHTLAGPMDEVWCTMDAMRALSTGIMFVPEGMKITKVDCKTGTPT